jgi:hypothetical protein
MEFYGHCPELHKTIDPRFRRFWDTCWQVFVQELVKEQVTA